MDYHEGVFAATECRDAKFSQADYQILESRINQRAGETIHTGRQLQLIEAAKAEINAAISHAGFAAPQVPAAPVRFRALRGYPPQSRARRAGRRPAAGPASPPPHCSYH